MKILSLFDGISCARVALERAGIPVEAYYASEIDKYAIQISQKNYPDIKQIGNVTDFDDDFRKIVTPIDLLIGGSPCQDLSIAKKNRKGLSGERSGLFWEYVRILKEVKPKWFILENVNSMPKEAKELITKTLGVEPIMIDAALVSAQRRKRLFWTNIPNVTLPEDRGILLKDILESMPDNDIPIKEKSKTIRSGGRRSELGSKQEWDSVYQYRRTYWRETKGGKVPTLTANMGTGGNNVPYVQGAASRTWPRNPTGQKREKRIELNKVPKANSMTLVQGDSMVAIPPSQIRKLTCIECERLQCLPDNYTGGVSNTQRYKCLGNAFCVDVVAHILGFIPK